MTYHRLGWDSFFAHALEHICGASFENSCDATPGHKCDTPLLPARVVGVQKNCFIVNDGNREYRAVLAGSFFNPVSAPALFPAAGDWVALRGQVITDVLPRKNALVRGASGRRDKRVTHAVAEQVMAANLDWVFIVCGLDRDFNLRRIERYLTLVYNSGCSPVILLNKADLHGEPGHFVEQVEDVAMGVPVHLVAAKTDTGLDSLEPYLCAGLTVALIGSSGAGKSTLVNTLAGRRIQAVRPVSLSMGGKGVHTTTSRELIQLPSGGMLIDNPGIREIAFWDDGDGIDAVFADIDALSQTCRFADCRHDGEPGCRVQAAVESGDLPPERLQSYLKMKRELDYVSQRAVKSADRVEKERWQHIAKQIKKIKKKK